MQSHILHVISKSHPLWQVHEQSHLTRHIKIPPPLASTCKVTSYTSYQKPTPSGKYMHSLILHVISKSHPLWQVHAQSHLTRHIKIPPPLASTCTITSHITRSKSHPLWQAHTKSHFTVHMNTPSPSGRYMHSLILHVISKSHPLWQVHAQSHLRRHIKNPPLWQVHAQSHLTRHIKIPPPLASTCKVTSYTSYQNPTASGKYMHSLILHVISKSHPLWQVHAQSHLTRHVKIPPPLASTCTITSQITRSKSHPLWQAHTKSHFTVHMNTPSPSGRYMHSLILHVISKPHPLWQVHAQSHLTRHIKIPPLWQVHAQSHLTRHIKIPPPLASTCAVSSNT